MLSLSGRARLKPWKLRRKNLRSPSGWLKLNVHQPNKYPTDINRKYDNSHFKNSRTNMQCQHCNNINNSTQSYYATYSTQAWHTNTSHPLTLNSFSGSHRFGCLGKIGAALRCRQTLRSSTRVSTLPPQQETPICVVQKVFHMFHSSPNRSKQGDSLRFP